VEIPYSTREFRLDLLNSALHDQGCAFLEENHLCRKLEEVETMAGKPLIHWAFVTQLTGQVAMIFRLPHFSEEGHVRDAQGQAHLPSCIQLAGFIFASNLPLKKRY